MTNPQTDHPLNRTLAAARVVVSLFETGKKHGNPAALAVLDDGAGLSYGLHQATHRAGSLAKIVQAYAILQPLQTAIANDWYKLLINTSAANVTAQADNQKLRNWLKAAAHDPLMLRAQHEVFDREYLQPAMRECDQHGFNEPLSRVVVYDAFIQGGWRVCRDRTNDKHSAPVAEQEWIDDYLDVREAYLASLKSKAARASVYRPRALRELVKAGNWGLATPFKVRGSEITEVDLQ